MNKALAVAVAALSVLALTACSAPARMSDSDFLTLVHEHTTTLTSSPDKDILSVVDSACKALQSGTTKGQVVAVIAGSNTTPTMKTDIGYLIGAGVPVYCPDQKGKL